MSRHVSHDGRGALRVRFGFDRRLVDLVKSLPNRRWNGDQKYWSVPETDVVALVDLLEREGFSFDEATVAAYVAAGGTRALAAAASTSKADDTQRGLWDVPSPGATTPFADLSPIASGDGADRPGSPDDYTVGRLNREVRAAIEAAFPQSIWIVGEIANFNKGAHRRHVGFTILERAAGTEQPVAEVNAILFADTRAAIEAKLREAGDPFRLEDEIEVRMRARVELYEAWGQYRLRIEDLDVAYTLGEAARRREEIVRRLGEEGLLERNRALAFPALPLRVGLVTSLGSDAFNDVLKTLKESGFAFRITAHGARVQGRQTEPSVLNALDWFRERAASFDVVLVCRGGGSRTDLAWFDSEALGRAVALFPLPVVVGIGHEQDRSVLDFVGWRAKTPTAAAALLVERVRAALDATEQLGARILDAARLAIEQARRTDAERARRIARAVRALVESEKTHLARIARQLPRAAQRRTDLGRMTIDQAVRQLAQAARRDCVVAARRIADAAAGLAPRVARHLVRESERLEGRARRLALVDPRRVVERGYAVLRLADGPVVLDPAIAPAGTALTAEIKRGILRLRSEGAIHDDTETTR